MNIISENMKTGYSLNTMSPIEGEGKSYCQYATKRCKEHCYGMTGRFTIPAVKKANKTRTALLEDMPELYFSRLSKEISQKVMNGKMENLRLNGVGEVGDDHINDIINIAKKHPEVKFWGFTRSWKFWEGINAANLDNLSIILSLDPTSDEETTKKAKENLEWKVAWGPSLPGEIPPTKKEYPNLLVIFPYHFHGKTKKGFEKNKLNCPSIVGKISHGNSCQNCTRCLNV